MKPTGNKGKEQKIDEKNKLSKGKGKGKNEPEEEEEEPLPQVLLEKLPLRCSLYLFIVALLNYYSLGFDLFSNSF